MHVSDLECEKEGRNAQKMGNQRNTAHALKPRRTSSTHRSSKSIHDGLVCSRLGLTFSQKSSARKFLYVLTGLIDHRPRDASAHSLSARASTDDVGGDRT